MLIKYIILGIVQGVTEFLPISSSGHLIIFEKFLNIPQDLTLDVTLHLATLIAIVLYYRLYIFNILIDLKKDSKILFKKKISFNNLSQNTKIVFFILIASIPAVIFGALFSNFFESVRSVLVVAVMLIIVALFMLYEQFKKTDNSDLKALDWKKALVIGFAQSVALIPGTSRSGATITIASLLGIHKKDAADFSFLLSIPVVFGAFLLKVMDIKEVSYFLNPNLIISFFFSLISGYLSIKFLISLLKKYGFFPFIIYRILLATILLIVMI